MEKNLRLLIKFLGQQGIKETNQVYSLNAIFVLKKLPSNDSTLFKRGKFLHVTGKKERNVSRESGPRHAHKLRIS